MKKVERENSKSEHKLPGMTAKSDKWITRKLEGICQSLTLPENQGKVVEFLANSKNVQRINGLVEDIHEALMDYQVCILSHSFSTIDRKSVV